jgi:glycosyltransferase involved in cell wall biosynthesis
MTRATSSIPPRVSVIAPIHNEVEGLEQLVRETVAALEPLSGGHEILLVDDGSEDGSGEVIEELAFRYTSVRPLRRARRGGQSAAILAGILAARGEIVVTIDSDLQNDPADIPHLLDQLAGHDLVGGIRVDRQDQWHRKVASRFANALRRFVLGDSFVDVGCSLKAYRAAYLRDLPPFDGLHRFLPVIVEHRGARVKEVPVRHRARPYGTSKYSVGGRALRGIVDLFAVRWLRRRAIEPSLVEETRPRAWSPSPVATLGPDEPGEPTPRDERTAEASSRHPAMERIAAALAGDQSAVT